MTNQEKDLQNAREYLSNPENYDLESNQYFLIQNGRIVLTEDELAHVLNNYIQHLESIGKIKFTENQHDEEAI